MPTLIDEVRSTLTPDYLITHELGRGGMGVVYDAYHRTTYRRVAIKILPPELAFLASVRDRFIREAQLAATLDHPGIVRVYHAGQLGRLAYFVMSNVAGESLAHRVSMDGALDFTSAHLILHDVADALDYAHSAGIVHRDVKPDNILIDALTGRPVLTDFGIARALDDDARMTISGTALGTPSFMAPEQALGHRDVTAASDIFALGVVGYLLLTGELPFTAENTPALITKLAYGPHTPVIERCPEAPPKMAAAIERALAKQPADRWPSAAAFASALGEVPPVAPARRVASKPLRAGRANRGLRTAGVAHRIRQWRRKAVVLLMLTIACMILNVIFDREFFAFIGVAWVCAHVLAVNGAHLIAEDVSIRELIRDPIDSESSELTHQVPLLSTGHHSARYEAARRAAAREHAEIARLLRGLSRLERRLIPDVAPTAAALQAEVVALADDLRRMDESHEEHLDDLPGSLLLRLDSAADALQALRLCLADLRDSDFERGLSALHEQVLASGSLVRESTPPPGQRTPQTQSGL